jgi:beta-lactamase regulating signal transducer with metallopeptidase domain
MKFLSELLALPIFQAIGAALLHFVWQGALVALLVASLSVLLQKRSANARYLVACAGLALMLVLPAVTGLIAYEGLPAPPSVKPILSSPAPAPFDAPRFELGSLTNRATTTGSTSRPIDWRGNFNALMPWLVALWLTGVLIFSVRAIGGWLLVRRLRRQHNRPAPAAWQETVQRLAKTLRVSRSVRLCESVIAEVPGVIGWLRPVILVPVGALAGLDSAQVEAVLAHEMAHIRRHDYLVNLLQTVVESLLFYHPGVWWVSRRIRIEREHCCDDLAVAACGDAVMYARALTAMEGLRATPAPQLAMAADGGSLLGRVRRLLGVTSTPSRATAFSAALILFVSLGGIGLGAHHALLPVVTAKAAAIRYQVTALLTSKPQTSGASTVAIDANGQPLPHPVAEVNVPIAPDDVAPSAIPAPPEPPAELPVLPDPGGPQDGGSFIDEMAAAGYTNLTVDQLVALRVHGVTAAFIKDLKAAGYDRLSVERVAALAVQGVTGDYARAMNAAGFGRLEVDQLLAAKIHNATPDYLHQMQNAVKDADFGQLLAFRIHGVTLEYIREYNALGFGEPSANQLVAAKIHGVTGAFVREMQGLGLGKLSCSQILALRIHGVTTEFVKTVRARGFNDVTVEQIIELKRMNIIKNN